MKFAYSSNSGNPTARRIGWIVAVIACVASIVAIGLGSSTGSRYEQLAAGRAGAHAHLSSAISIHCAEAPGTALSPRCVRARQILEQNDKIREYDDLVAQQRSALWTSIMGWTAVFGVLLSSVGVYFIRQTLQAQTEATIASTTALAIESARSLPRLRIEPYLHIRALQGSEPLPLDLVPFTFHVSVRNVGHTDAEDSHLSLVDLKISHVDFQALRLDLQPSTTFADIPHSGGVRHFRFECSGDAPTLDNLRSRKYIDVDVHVRIDVSYVGIDGRSLRSETFRARLGQARSFEVPLGGGVTYESMETIPEFVRIAALTKVVPA